MNAVKSHSDIKDKEEKKGIILVTIGENDSDQAAIVQMSRYYLHLLFWGYS